MNKVYLLGDSTCQTNDETTYPQTGWGQVVSSFLRPDLEIINLAKNGRSTKSFLDEGLFKPCEENVGKGDYVFIQFGHNDEKEDPARHTDPFSTYQENLMVFIQTAKEAGATPVLLSSIYRRQFDESGRVKENCHLDYPKAMEELARKEQVLYIDMCTKTKAMLEELGDEPSKALFMNFPAGMYPNYPEGKEDNTHLRPEGAKRVCELLTMELKKVLPELF